MATGTTASRNLEGGSPITRTAGGAIAYGAAVKLDTTEGQVIVTTAITDVVIGVAMNAAASGENVEIQTTGVAPTLVSVGVALGAQVMPTAAGAGKCMTAAGATARSFGVAESLTDTDGQLARVRLATPNLNGPANS